MKYIYQIVNLINKKKYIGQTNNFEERIYKHFYLARTGCKRHLYNAMRYYGLENFQASIIEECEDELVSEREQFWINEYKTTDKRFGYNKTDGGEKSNSWEYNDHKEKTSRLLSEKLKGHRVNEEAVRRLADSRRGTHLSEETKRKISETLKRKYKSGEIKVTPPSYVDRTGSHHTDDAKRRMSQYRKNKTYDEIYGEETAAILRKQRAERWKRDKNPQYKEVPVEDIIRLINAGKSNKEIAEIYGVTAATIWNKLKEVNLTATQIRRKEKGYEDYF